MLKFIVKLLKALNSNSHPGEIAHAVCLGMLLGFLPKKQHFLVYYYSFCSFYENKQGCARALYTGLFAARTAL